MTWLVIIGVVAFSAMAWIERKEREMGGTFCGRSPAAKDEHK